MKTYKFNMNCGYVGTDIEDFFDFDDNVTEDELQETWKDWAFGLIDGGFEEIHE